MKAAIVSFFMNNIHTDTITWHDKVVKKYNRSGVDHLRIQTNGTHGASMDYIWASNKELKYDVIMFLDIDCIPLHPDALDYFLLKASEGKLIGNAQRSNHIENNQHVFAAPNAVAMSADTYEKIGRPSAEPNYRGDVGEEYTFAAEEHGVPVEIVLPLKFDRAPRRMVWETDQSPHWALADGMPVYGLGTTFGDTRELFWHSFQIFHAGHQEIFWKRCEEELNR